MIAFYEDWLKEDDGPKEDTQAQIRKREDIEKTKAKRAAAANAEEEKNIEAKASKIDSHYDLKANQADAAALSKWDVVRDALEDMSAECRIDRADEDPDDVKEIDPTLWNCQTLKILRIRVCTSSTCVADRLRCDPSNVQMISLFLHTSSLQMPKTHLTAIPSELGLLTNLTELIVAHNSLTTIPSAIGKLVHLKALEAEVMWRNLYLLGACAACAPECSDRALSPVVKRTAVIAR